MGADTRPFKYPTVPSFSLDTQPLPTPPLASGVTAVRAVEFTDDQRWAQWIEKGKREAAAFNVKVRVAASVVGGVVAIAAVIWFVAGA